MYLSVAVCYGGDRAVTCLGVGFDSHPICDEIGGLKRLGLNLTLYMCGVKVLNHSSGEKNTNRYGLKGELHRFHT